MREKQLFLFGLFMHLCGFLLFMKGFFPSKVVLYGVNQFPGGESPFKEHQASKFERLILVVVDALRSDFLFSRNSSMHFVHSLIEQGSAIPFTAFSNPPTVTLPRLKGITTGSTPNFLDAILNVADDKDTSQSLSKQDSWVKQLLLKNKKLNFFGDDTWLKLFPPEEYFESFDGTNSFFVSDFTEVDNNVTRHLNTEFLLSDWDVLILHYLGLDHIGHKGGPRSSFMPSKQKEMDQIIENLYERATDDTLLVVMGDHGMNEIGNHGGSSPGETSPGLLLASPKFQKLGKNLKCPLDYNADYKYYDKINQIDIVPTLAALLDFPIPKNSLGVFIRDLLPLWKLENQIKILKENCEHLLSLYRAKYGQSNLEHKWEKQKLSNSIDSYYDFLYSIQNQLTASAAEYKYHEIFLGLALLLGSTGISLLTFRALYLKNKSQSVTLYIFFATFIFFYVSHFFASSLIEEEHQVWWFLSCLTIMTSYFARKIPQGSTILLLIGIRLIRSWCNSGQKHYALSFSDYLLGNPDILWKLNIITYVVATIMVYSEGELTNCFMISPYVNFKEHLRDVGSMISFIIVFVTSTVSFLFKLCQYFNDGNNIPNWLYPLLAWIGESHGVPIGSMVDNQLHALNVSFSKLFFVLLAVLASTRVVLGKFRQKTNLLLTDISNMITMLLIHQTRVEIIPIFLVFFFVKFTLRYILSMENVIPLNKRAVLKLSWITICLQNLSFLSMGNTNLIATVDLSNAYNGCNSYNIYIVGLLTIISTFAGPIFWSLSLAQMLYDQKLAEYNTRTLNRHEIAEIFQKKNTSSLLFYAISGLILAISCFTLRFHLFIWTVFSPKVLYFASWSLILNFLIEYLFIGALLCLK